MLRRLLCWLRDLFWRRAGQNQRATAAPFEPSIVNGPCSPEETKPPILQPQPATRVTRYAVMTKPTLADGYPQRIPMWEAVELLGTATADELLTELLREGYQRPRAGLDRGYCQHELTDMCRRASCVGSIDPLHEAAARQGRWR